MRIFLIMGAAPYIIFVQISTVSFSSELSVYCFLLSVIIVTVSFITTFKRTTCAVNIVFLSARILHE